MDWHKLQHTLFEIEPSDPREDLAKLQAQAGKPQESVAPTKDYLQESAEVNEGSLQMDRDYSVADFAALAGVQVNEGPMSALKSIAKDAGKSFGAGYKKGGDSDVFNKLGAITKPSAAGIDANFPGKKNVQKKQALKPTNATNKTKLNKTLTSRSTFLDIDDDYEAYSYDPDTDTWRSIKGDKKMSKGVGMRKYKDYWTKHTESEERISHLESRIDYLESVIERLTEADERKIKPRDPNWRDMEALRKSGAAGSHKDKKKLAKQGYSKHKGKQYESIADELWARLNAISKS